MAQDKFVLAVSKIAADEDARFFLEWLAQARVDALAELAEANEQTDILKKSGAACAFGDILASVTDAMAMAKLETPLKVSLTSNCLLTFTRPQKGANIVKENLIRKICNGQWFKKRNGR